MIIKPLLTLDVRKDNAKHWIVVGAGGNGGYLIPQLARMISIQNIALGARGLSKHQLTIIDADVIEDKNLVRQNFIRSDVARNKAEVMAARYSRAFNMEIDFLPEYIKDPKDLSNLYRTKGQQPVFVGAVDNNKTRKLIWDAYKGIQNAFWIDAGNEEWGGQVVCGYNSPYNAEEGMTKRRDVYDFRLPCVMDIYPEIMEAQDKLPTELSCAEHAVSAPQNIYTNQLASTIMLGFANVILTYDNKAKKGLRYHGATFNAELFGTDTRRNDLDNLQARYQAPKKEAVVQPGVEVPMPGMPQAQSAKKPQKKVAEAIPQAAPTMVV